MFEEFDEFELPDGFEADGDENGAELPDEQEMSPTARAEELAKYADHKRVASFENWDNNQTTILNPLRAIRAKCLDCCCGSSPEVSKCVSNCCPLHPWRFGCRPK